MQKENHTRSKDTQQKQKDVRLDKHSAMGVDPDPKKGGHKGWGNPEQQQNEMTVDPKDPNYDSGEEQQKEEAKGEIEEPKES